MAIHLEGSSQATSFYGAIGQGRTLPDVTHLVYEAGGPRYQDPDPTYDDLLARREACGFTANKPTMLSVNERFAAERARTRCVVLLGNRTVRYTTEEFISAHPKIVLPED